MTFLKTRNKSGKIPQRSCVACRVRGDKDNFIRIVINAEGNAVIDVAKKLPGRGAYICPALSCIVKANKGKKLAGALRSAINSDLWEKLEQLINERSNAIER